MKRLRPVVAVVVLLTAGCGLSGHSRPHQQVGAAAGTIRAAFNADVDKARVVALVSPTCGTCLNAATEMQRDVFSQYPSNNLAGFVVWVPKKGAHERNVSQATRTITDPRTFNYWDGDSDLVHAYAQVLHLDQDAWDIYLIYPPGPRWTTAAPPAPTYWMQQLSHTAQGPGGTGEWLDAATFARHVSAALNRASANTS